MRCRPSRRDQAAQEYSINRYDNKILLFLYSPSVISDSPREAGFPGVTRGAAVAANAAPARGPVPVATRDRLRPAPRRRTTSAREKSRRRPERAGAARTASEGRGTQAAGGRRTEPAPECGECMSNRPAWRHGEPMPGRRSDAVTLRQQRSDGRRPGPAQQRSGAHRAAPSRVTSCRVTSGRTAPRSTRFASQARQSRHEAVAARRGR